MNGRSRTGDTVIVTDDDVKNAIGKQNFESTITADNQISLKENRLSNATSNERVEKLKSDNQRDAERTSSMNKEIDVAYKLRVNLDEEIKLLTKNIEDVQSEIRNSDKKEREIRIALNNINNEVGTAFGLQKAGANEKVDVKILKGISSRVNQQLSSLEKEKTIQDAYVARMKRDVEASERELAQLGREFDELKKESVQRKSDYAELAEKLKAFEEGNISVEDRWQTLMKSLHSRNNKITLDRNETLDEKLRLLSKTAPTSMSEEELRREAMELLKIESILANREKIRRKKEKELEQFERAIQETNNAIAKTNEELIHLEDGIIKLAVKTADTKRQYAALRNSKGLKESEDDETSEAKKDLMELSMRRIAITQKIERLEIEANKLNERFIEQKKKLETLNEALRKAEIKKNSFDKESQAIREVTVDGEEEKREKELLAKLERENAKVASMKDENNFLEKNVQASREEVDMWRKKLESIEDDEAFTLDDQQRNGVLVETRRLKNLHSNLLKRIRETQKELEMCALRRDFVVGKAQTTISTGNHIRSQAIDEIQRLKNRIVTLQKEIDETNAKYVRLQMLSTK
uniref:Uncharacterized protein n=1 Tax=Parascaris univalens TaxID=6257 RepID=A0A915A9D6_PARUN